MSYRPFARHFGCRVSDALTYSGLRLVVLENELLRVAVLPEKGADILEFRYKPADVDPLLHMRGGLRSPAPYPPTSANSDGAFLDAYSGGWPEMFPSAGGPCRVAGAEYGRHGEVALLPWQWDVTEDSAERVTVRFRVRTVRSPFLLERSMTLETGRPVLGLAETVTNEGGEPTAFMWGHHPTFGSPFLDGGCIVEAPAAQVEVQEGPSDPTNRLQPGSRGAWPMMAGAHGETIDLRRVPPPGARSADMLYLTGLRAGWCALSNPALGLGFALAWPVDVFPYLWVWQEFAGSGGYPWYGAVRAMGLEPCTAYTTSGTPGLAGALATGRARTLPPGGRLDAWLTAVAYTFPAGGGGQTGAYVQEVTPTGEVKLVETSAS